jgi:cell division protein FtsW (lipid II flippase)
VTIPTKGISLPFISAGGTGIIFAGAAMGLLTNIARHIRPMSEQTFESIVLEGDINE